MNKDEIQEHIERLYGERHQSKPTAIELLAEMILNIEEEIEISVTTNDNEPNVFLIRLEKLEVSK